VEAHGRGVPSSADQAWPWHAAPPCRTVVHALLPILITGCRWGDAPHGPLWASEGAAHRRLRRRQGDGTQAARPLRQLGLTEARGMIQWPYGAVDGAFSLWHRRRWRVARGGTARVP
jgi:hypothetical protein